MENLSIRKANENDLNRILEIYSYARSYMAKTNNPTQWGGSYPSRELLESDIKAGHLYVIALDNALHGVFAFIEGEDPTYSKIVDGNWLSSSPYGTIHRIAGDGSIKGLFEIALDFCSSLNPHIRLDTHEDNKVMQHLAVKNGFRKCGTIFVEDGSPRIAFEKI